MLFGRLPWENAGPIHFGGEVTQKVLDAMTTEEKAAYHATLLAALLDKGWRVKISTVGFGKKKEKILQVLQRE